MRNKNFVVYLLVAIALTICAPKLVFSDLDEGENRLEAILETVSKPRLIAPADSAIDLSGVKALKFEWGLAASPLVAIDYIEFYLYKGEAVNEKNLLFGKRLANSVYSIDIDPAIFEAGKFYTWGVKQFFLRGKESNKSFITFQVYK